MAKLPDWQAKYIQNRQAGQNVLGPVTQTPPNFSRPANGPAPQEFDITDKLQQRVMQRAGQGASGGAGAADLVEGLHYYTRLQTEAFGHTVALFKTAGIINGPTSKGVQVKGEVSGYVIDNMNSVDMSKITENAEKVVLVEVQVPFLGTFLVPKEAVINRGSGPMGDGRTLLKG